MADKRVERVTAVEANLTSPSISPDIITETVSVGAPNRVAATSIEKECTSTLWSKLPLSREVNGARKVPGLIKYWHLISHLLHTRYGKKTTYTFSWCLLPCHYPVKQA